MKDIGKPYWGKLNVRIDEGTVGGSPLFYSTHLAGILVAGILVAGILLLLLPSVNATSYVHGANGELVARINEANITYYHSDHLGSSSAMTDEGGR